MSAITGPSKHCWKRLFTPNVGSAPAKERMTFYYCVKCKHLFTHFYHLKRDIYEAMESERVPTECMPDTVTLEVSQESAGTKEADQIAEQMQQTGKSTFHYKKMFVDDSKQEILEVVKVGDSPAVKLTTDFQHVLDQACTERGLCLVKLPALKEMVKQEDPVAVVLKALALKPNAGALLEYVKNVGPVGLQKTATLTPYLDRSNMLVYAGFDTMLGYESKTFDIYGFNGRPTKTMETDERGALVWIEGMLKLEYKPMKLAMIEWSDEDIEPTAEAFAAIYIKHHLKPTPKAEG